MDNTWPYHNITPLFKKNDSLISLLVHRIGRFTIGAPPAVALERRFSRCIMGKRRYEESARNTNYMVKNVYNTNSSNEMFSTWNLIVCLLILVAKHFDNFTAKLRHKNGFVCLYFREELDSASGIQWKVEVFGKKLLFWVFLWFSLMELIKWENVGQGFLFGFATTSSCKSPLYSKFGHYVVGTFIARIENVDSSRSTYSRLLLRQW